MGHDKPNRNVIAGVAHAEQAKTRTEQAATRAEQARTRSEQAETRTEQAGTQTGQDKIRTEQADTQTQQAGTRSEQTETRTAQAKTRTEQARTRTQQAETKTEQAGTRTKQAGTQTDQDKTRTEQAQTRTEQDKTRTEQAETRTEQAKTWTMEQSLRASELSYRRLFEAARDGILILDVETGRITDVNPFLVELLGFSHAEMVGKTVGELSPFKDVVSNQTMLEQLQKDGYVRYEDLPLETRNGKQIAVEFVSNIYQAGDKKVIQCNIRDITERKRKENQLNASLREIADLRSALDQHSVVSITNPQGIITYVNDKFCARSKYSREELLGQNHRLVNSGHHTKEFFRDLWDTIEHGRVWHGEIKNKARDGSLYWVDATIMPFLDDLGKPRQYVAIRNDITERKAAEEKILQLNTELEQRVVARTAELEAANKELEAFSYSVSHDLRAPLRAVDGFSKAVLEDYGAQLPEEGRRYLQIIREGTQKMGMLIDDLLTFSRLSRAPLNKQPVNTGELVRIVLKDLRLPQAGRQIDLRIGDLPMCAGDPALLKQVWINLIANAFKYTRLCQPAVIEIGCTREQEENIYFVRDNGAGFDMRFADKLFGVFQRLHRAEDYEGTGVGLAIVQRVIHRHGGRVWANAAVNHGATFYFTLEGHTQP